MQHPYTHLHTTLEESENFFFDFGRLCPSRVSRLPFCVRVLLESAVRNCDEFRICSEDVQKILHWEDVRGPDVRETQNIEISFIPSRVLLQDFTGVPCMADLAAMRGAMQILGADPQKINPQVPVHLVIDHSVQADRAKTAEAREFNEGMELERNRERFTFLKWAAKSFDNTLIVPPGSGIVHQVNLESLAEVTCCREGLVFPDSVVGTDSHTTMIDGLGIVGWGVGGIEAEAVMLGQAMSLVLPCVYGVRLVNDLAAPCTATDLVLHITETLRSKNVVDSFVEFFGDACERLSVQDRATVSNMAPEYGATVAYFPVDVCTLRYLKDTGRNEDHVKLVEAYCKRAGLFRFYDQTQDTPTYTDVFEIDLSQIKPCVAGPKRPQDKICLTNLKHEFKASITAPVSFRGFGVSEAEVLSQAKVSVDGQEYTLTQGSVVLAAITSCTNTSNPSVMLGAGLLAQKAVALGLRVPGYIKTSLSPGSGVVQRYLEEAGLLPSLEQLGFYIAGLGCMTCIGNSGDLPPEVSLVLQQNPRLVVASVLSGNRNFEGRVHPLTRANFLASPPLCVAFALAGRVDIDFQTEPLGVDLNGKGVLLSEIWPSREEISALEEKVIKPAMFKEVYQNIKTGNAGWQSLMPPEGSLWAWPSNSTYLHEPPFFKKISEPIPTIPSFNNARCLLLLGDSITTDHISPAGRIEPQSPAGVYLQQRGVQPKDFNSYGSRRGNDEVMTRGTFANIRLINKLASRTGPYAVHAPTGVEASVFDVAEMYRKEEVPLIIFAGREYGSGSSRDWAAKGVALLGVRVVVATSYERIHRSNLVGMGVLPLQFVSPQNAETLGLNGSDTFSISMEDVDVKSSVAVHMGDGRSFVTKCRIDTQSELAFFKNGGILPFVVRKLAAP